MQGGSRLGNRSHAEKKTVGKLSRRYIQQLKPLSSFYFCQVVQHKRSDQRCLRKHGSQSKLVLSWLLDTRVSNPGQLTTISMVLPT
ncbi:hypothetical protein RRG08_048453 [Elysia crispata]|uniref:Uncharacterized protein n=1 Tax=Elysia crispata TaxID=231223 RepID=A0AAE1BAA3_9GAST|nr:hypothetical protein RRG08_048453 [Elysia crispata]